MTFVTPALLAGTALIAVPIVLHLVMRQQPKHLEFPALRFLQYRRKTNRRQMRLRHWLLLALRCIAIALVAISLARPSIGPDGLFGSGSSVLGDREAPVAAALVFDTSPRMLYRHQNTTRLDDAREMGLWLLTQLPDESQLAVLDSKREPAAFSVDTGAATQHVERLAMTAAARPLSDSIDEALRTLKQSERERKELYIFSDLTLAAWPPQNAERLERLLSENKHVSVYVIDVGATEPRNFSLSGLELKSGLVLSQNTPLELSAEMSSVGEAAERTVEMFIRGPDDQWQPRARKVVRVEADETLVIDFPPVSGLTEGLHQGYLEISEDDSLAIDNRLYFTFEVHKAWRVLVAAPEPEENYAKYLVEAIAPAPFRREQRARFACDVIPLEQLAERSLDDYRAVCLVDPDTLGEAAWDRLFAYTVDGGSIAIFLGHNASRTNFNSAAAQQVLPGPLDAIRTEADFDHTSLVPLNFEHAALSHFKRAGPSLAPWRAFDITKSWLFGKLKTSPAVVTLIEFANGNPALVEQAVGRGRVLTMTTSISDAASRNAWNLLPSHSWFDSVMSQLLLYMVGNHDQQLNYTAGESILLRLGTDRRFTRFLLTPPEPAGDNETAKGYLVNVDPKDNSIYITATDTPGNYRIEAGGRAEGVLLGFSTNLAPRVTGLVRASRDELQEMFGDNKVRIAANREEIEREVSGGRVGAELFPYFMLLLACVLLGEHILSTRFYRGEK